MGKSSKLFVGMDVHKASIDVGTGDDAGGEVRHYGAIGGDLASVSRLARKLESTGKVLVFVYEAGPCGFGLYRMLRAREDAVSVQRQVRQRLGALLLRNNVRYNGKTAWTPAHRRWIAELKLPHSAQHIAFEEYAQAIDEAGKRIERLEAAWAYRHGARVSVGIARRRSGLPKPVTDLAWKAQLRLCSRYRKLSARGWRILAGTLLIRSADRHLRS